MTRNSRDDNSGKQGRKPAQGDRSNNNRSNFSRTEKFSAVNDNPGNSKRSEKRPNTSKTTDLPGNRKQRDFSSKKSFSTTPPAFRQRDPGAGKPVKPDEAKTGGRKNFKSSGFTKSGTKPESPARRSRPQSSTTGAQVPRRQRSQQPRQNQEEHVKQQRTQKTPSLQANKPIRLNRYIANAGVCSRRKADELIQAGVISVNGEVITALGSTVDPQTDVVRYNNETLKREKNIYVLLNKPKDYITTTDDPQERRTVMHLVQNATSERIYPVGRLDRNTTGLLLMTNDGSLADKLMHPRNNVIKIYNVELNKNLSQGDLNKIAYGLELEDGPVKPDAVSYVQGGSKREIGIQIHTGKNRIVRRIFEHLGYEVVKLDRVVYANLTKKDLPRGRWRYLEEREIIQLKHLMN